MNLTLLADTHAICQLEATPQSPTGPLPIRVDHSHDRGAFNRLLSSRFAFIAAINLLSNHVPCEAGIALVVAVYSAIKRQSALAGLVILGDLSILGNIRAVRSLAEPLQVGMDNGARRALVLLENKRNFLESFGRHRGAG